MEIVSLILKDKLILTNNDHNISEIIISYLRSMCNVCEDDYLVGELTELYIDYKDHQLLICDDCIKTSCCGECGAFVDCYKDAKKGINIHEEMYICADSYCDDNVIFCSDCKNDHLYFCNWCEHHFCCRKIYRVDSDYFCEKCLKDSIVFCP